MTMRSYSFLEKYKEGFIIGLIYGILSIVIFFYSLRYAISCSDAIPCSSTVYLMIDVSFVFSFPFLLIEGAINYIVFELASFLFMNEFILPSDKSIILYNVITLILTIILFGVIGSFVQKLAIAMRKRKDKFFIRASC
ncbi:MAG: hypothetical protein AABX73_03705 [Nanoarchaeota archaeon]